MAIVTLLTDSGESNYYVAAIKAKIMGINPGLALVDISHQIQACDLAQGAYVLRSVFRDFPKGTVHLVGVDAAGQKEDIWVAAQLEDHFFVTPDSGILGLVSERQPMQTVQLNTIQSIVTTFPEKDILAIAAAKLASGVAITTLGKPVTGLKKMIDRQIKANKRLISGHVVRVDHYGNLITNISRDVFQTLSAGKNFTIQFGGERFKRLHAAYHQADQGDCFVLFNSLGWLEIGINKGNAHELLGLTYDSPISIIFEE